MSKVSHVRYQTETPPFVPFVDYIAPTHDIGEIIRTAIVAAARSVDRGRRALFVKMREIQAAETLTRLDDHTLNDIGIHRSQIPDVARLVAANSGVDYRVWCR